MSELFLTNTLSRSKERFVPEDRASVRMYVCGPTVYDDAHIGNARPAVVFDLLFRLLRFLYGDGSVLYVRNITDVDDKINARALRDHGRAIETGEMTLNAAIASVTKTTAARYEADMAALGCLKPTHQPRATDYVLPRADGKMDMASLIQNLLDRGHAYLATGSEGAEILFDTTTMADYGRLSRRDIAEQEAGARVAVESHKKSPGDFVLWKESTASQPGWEASFRVAGGTRTILGRPGWHIECSAMSAALLGDTFDIHGGGLDLIFPHHENELAQSCCAQGNEQMARYWLHNGFLQVEGRKMSKSEGNFVTVKDLLETDRFGGKSWRGDVLRLALLMTHYREPIDFSVRRLEEASNLLSRLRRRAGEPRSSGDENAILNALCDDLNTPLAIQALSQMSGGPLAEVMTRLGLDPAMPKADGFDEAAIDAAITRRLSLLAEKKFAEADAIRDELGAQGVQLKDGKDPQTGERVTDWEVKG